MEERSVIDNTTLGSLTKAYEEIGDDIIYATLLLLAFAIVLLFQRMKFLPKLTLECKQLTSSTQKLKKEIIALLGHKRLYIRLIN